MTVVTYRDQASTSSLDMPPKTSTSCCTALAIILVTCRSIISSQESDDIGQWLPRTYSDFQNKFTCINEQDLENRIGNEDDFILWVVSARHTTWTHGWAVPLANNADFDIGSAHGSSEKYYARVFDLLNKSRLQNLFPEWIDADNICHKGMEVMFGYASNGLVMTPKKPNKYISDDTWSTLWATCHKQLNDPTRISTSCIDIPGIVVSNPNPPYKVNNPCHYEFRMVDGAHRLCLRKYLMTLIEGQLSYNKLQLALTDEIHNSSERASIQSHIAKLQLDMKRAHHGSFFVLNQTTFESLLTNIDPQSSWAKDENTLMQGISIDLIYDWKQWMTRVMANLRVGEPRNVACTIGDGGSQECYNADLIDRS